MDVHEFHRQVIALLIAERERAGLNQGQLAQRLNLHQSRLSRLESGERQIKLTEFFVIARAIGFNPHNALRRVHKVKRGRRPLKKRQALPENGE